MKTEEIISRLKGVHRSPQGWMGQCPAHEDRSPSLSICEREGKILLHCFAGCAIESICAAIAIKVSDLFPNSCILPKRVPPRVRVFEGKLASLRSRLTPLERERNVTVVIVKREQPDAAMARALALSVQGELVQVFLEDEH
jgi:putative DNA primase/helicase